MDRAAQRRGLGRLPRPPVWAIGALFPLALVPFATVHPLPRVVLGFLAGLLGLWAIAYGAGRREALSKEVATLALGGALATALSAAAFVPVGPEARQALQPALAEVVLESLAFVGAERAPLALDPHRALTTWAASTQLLIFAVGVALVVRSSTRAARLGAVLLGAGVCLVAIAAAHRATGAESIWWVTDVPSFSRAPFFGPFVNPNHGGVACAALLPIAAAFAMSRRTSNRVTGVVSLIALLVGLRLSGSRGALLAGAAGGLAFVALVGGPRVRRAGGALVALGALGALAVGPDLVAEQLSLWLVPEALGPGEDLYTGRGEIWTDVWGLVASAPLIGVGPAGFDDAFQVIKTSPTFSRLDHAHQELLQIAAEQGLVVLVVWALVTLRLVASGVAVSLDVEQSRHRRRMLAAYLGAGAALFTACLYTFPLRIGALELLAALLLGAVAGLGGGRRGTGWLSPRAATALGLALLCGSLVAGGLALGSADHARSPWGSAELALQAGEAERERIAAGEGSFEQAKAWYLLALRRQPLRREPLQLLSRLERYHGGSYGGAVYALELATRVYPSLPWPHRDLARLRAAALDDAEARLAWRDALACDLPEELGPELVAEALEGPGDPAERLAAVIPPRADRLASAGRVMEKQELWDVAEQAYAQAAALDPRYGAHLGAALLRRGRAQEALEAALALEPPSCFSLRVTAEAREALGDTDGATRDTRRAMSACGEEHDRELRLLGARLQLAAGDDKALDVFKALLDESPEDHPVRRMLIAELRERRWEEQLAKQLRVLVDAGAARPAEERELAALTARGISGR